MINLAYWLRDPIDGNCLEVLKRVAEGRQAIYSEQFEEAYLIARGCIMPDDGGTVLEITPKGRDALSYMSR